MSFSTRLVSGHLIFSFFIIALLGIPFAGAAKVGDTMISTIYHNAEGAGVEVVEFRLSGDLLPKVFRLPGKIPRLVIDFFNTGYSGPTRIEPETARLVQRIRVGFHNIPEPKTRVVLDLLPNREIDWQKTFITHNNTLRFTFKEKGADSVTGTAAVTGGPAQTPAQVKVFTALPSKVKRGSAGEREQRVVPTISADQKKALGQRAEPSVPGDKKVPKEVPERSVLQDVAFDDLQVRNGEMVLFKLNKFYPPTISAREKGRPQVICDFTNTIIAKNIDSPIEAKGQFVDTIEVAPADQGMARVVLNLYPGKDYDLQQVFFQEDKLFVLIVSDLEAEE